MTLASPELSDEQLRIVERVQKILALADRNPNQAEAAVAAGKAQELLEAYNLDMIIVERASGATGKREMQHVTGGMYQHQRDLWAAVARLNFCVYFARRTRELNRAKIMRWRFKHQLVGRVVNVRTAMHMGQYLETAIERELAERLHERFSDPSHQRFGNWASSFRQGAVHELVGRLVERRQLVLDEEEARQRAAAEEAARRGGSTATALTLGDVTERERDANMDFIHGEGYSARNRARRAEAAREAEQEQREWTEWCAAHPEEVRRMENERREREERLDRARQRRRRQGVGPRESYGRADNTDYGAWDSGARAAKSISLDEQAGTRKSAGRIGHG